MNYFYKKKSFAICYKTFLSPFSIFLGLKDYMQDLQK